MIRCSQCKLPSARIVTVRELTKLSKKHYVGAAVATAATASATTMGAVGATALVAKAASTSSGSPLTKLAMVAATAAASGLVKLALDRWSAGNGKCIYCSNCGHQEPFKSSR